MNKSCILAAVYTRTNFLLQTNPAVWYVYGWKSKVTCCNFMFGYKVLLMLSFQIQKLLVQLKESYFTIVTERG